MACLRYPPMEPHLVRRGVRVTVRHIGYYAALHGPSTVRGTVLYLNESGRWTIWMDKKEHPHGRFRSAFPDDLLPVHVIHLLAELVDPPEAIDP